MNRSDIKYIDISAVPDEYLARDILPNRSSDEANIITFSDIAYLLNFFDSRYRMRAGIFNGAYDLAYSERKITEYKRLSYYNLYEWFTCIFEKSMFLTAESLPPTNQLMTFDVYKSYYAVGPRRSSFSYKFPTDNKLLQKSKIQDVYDWAKENLLPLERGVYQKGVNHTAPTEWTIVSDNGRFDPGTLDSYSDPIMYRKVDNDNDDTAYDPTEYNGEAYALGTFDDLDMSIASPADTCLEITCYLGWRIVCEDGVISAGSDATYFYTPYTFGSNITNQLSDVFEFIKSQISLYERESLGGMKRSVQWHAGLDTVHIFYKTKLTTIP